MIALQPSLAPGYRLHFHETIGSTNDEAKRLARDGAADGTVVWALEQTAGRGRRGRAWVSPRGNLYASMVLRPDCPAQRVPQLGFVAALAIGGALATLFPARISPSYKWPNDVLISGRKIAGILLESEMTAPDRLSFLVLGVGVNLSSSPCDAEFPATSLAEQNLGAVSPEIMLEEFARLFQSWQTRWREDGFEPVRAAWLAGATLLGEPIRVRLDAGAMCGRFLDIDHEGTLLLDCAGECRRIAAGEVFSAA